MKLLPVIDLKGRVVVRGIAGRRHEYQPIQSQLAADPKPGTVARAFVECGFQDVYVADLDAIAGAEPDWFSYEQIADADLTLMIDAGVSTVEQSQRLFDFGSRSNRPITAVAASESISHRKSLQKIYEIFGAAYSVFSLDLKTTRPIAACPDWKGAGPQEIIAEVIAIGFRRLIVLDLAAVGSCAGPMTLDLCRQVRNAFPDVELISGGGVRDEQDLEAFREAGCNRVLVASALHDGRLRRSNVPR